MQIQTPSFQSWTAGSDGVMKKKIFELTATLTKQYFHSSVTSGPFILTLHKDFLFSFTCLGSLAKRWTMYTCVGNVCIHCVCDPFAAASDEGHKTDTSSFLFLNAFCFPFLAWKNTSAFFFYQWQYDPGQIYRLHIQWRKAKTLPCLNPHQQLGRES